MLIDRRQFLIAGSFLCACGRSSSPSPTEKVKREKVKKEKVEMPSAKEDDPSYGVMRFTVNIAPQFTENVYLLWNLPARDAVIIDPGMRDDSIELFIKSEGLNVRGVLNTHGHYDHVHANRYYADLFSVKIMAHEGDLLLYRENEPAAEPDEYFSSIDNLQFGSLKINVLHTPGHSMGSVCYLVDGIVFSGDTLFKGSIGRTWGTTQEKQIKTALITENINKKLLVLANDTAIYPGHGPDTSIGYERKNNPFIIRR